jgi:hypothetical protein
MLSRIVRNLFKTQSPAQRAPSFEQLENRQMMAVSPVVAGTKLGGANLSAGGVSTNQSLITIPFSGNVTLVDKSKIQIRGYAINPVSGGQKKMVIRVIKAQVLASDHRFLQITTDRLMRKGGTVTLQSGALKDDKGNLLAEQARKAIKGQNKERFTLACRGFKPTDFAKFSTDTFASSPAPTAASSAPAEATVTAALGAFLQRKVDKTFITATQRTAALARYNNATTKSIIPDANLRAALVSLTGTLAEGAIASYLDGKNLSGKAYTIIDFQDPPDPTALVAQSIVATNGRIRTLVKPSFRGEAFQVLSAYLAHEALHQDTVGKLQEETIANVCETLTYAQQALTDSTFLSNGTTLVVGENEKLYALLESGRAIFPYVGLLNGPIHSSAGGIFVGGKTPASGGAYTSYIDFIERSYKARGATNGDTATNALMSSYYTNITGKKVVTTLKFNDALIADIDSFQQIISTKQAISLAGSLKLTLA